MAHKNHLHSSPKNISPMAQDNKSVLTEINEFYKKDIKKIFNKSCGNCHGGQTQYPFYYRIPIVQNIIDTDISESKKHLDFSLDFPFKSHATPQEDLAAITNAIKNDTMPPLRYRILHWDKKLSTSDKETILKWTKESTEKLRKLSSN